MQYIMLFHNRVEGKIDVIIEKKLFLKQFLTMALEWMQKYRENSLGLMIEKLLLLTNWKEI